MEAGEGLTEEHIHRDTKGSGEVCVHLITQDGRMYYPYSQRWRALVRFVYTSLRKTEECITHIHRDGYISSLELKTRQRCATVYCLR